MGFVYRAEDAELGRHVAIKVLLDGEESASLARGAGAGAALASQRHRRLRRRPLDERRLRRDGARRRPDARRLADAASRRARGARSSTSSSQAGERPGGGARRGPRAPRLQAGQRHGRHRRPRARARLRPGARRSSEPAPTAATARRRATTSVRARLLGDAAHAGGSVIGTPRVHGARAAPRRGPRPLRSVQLLRGAVPRAVRRAAVRRRSASTSIATTRSPAACANHPPAPSCPTGCDGCSYSVSPRIPIHVSPTWAPSSARSPMIPT